jgi:sugar lactone lactonase YvrE
MADGSGDVSSDVSSNVSAGDASVFWDGRATLGEGPVWDARLGTLYWVDILAGAVYAHHAGTDTDADADSDIVTRLDLGVQVGCLGLTEDPATLIAGLRSGWHLLDLPGGRLTFLADPEAERPSFRFNDGSVDPAGRFWTGSLEDSETLPVGRLYRLDPDGVYATVDTGFYCSNGMDWSPDGRWMYFVDSRADVVFRYAFDAATGVASGREIFADTTALPGIPDGLRVDAAGDIWCAFWDGAHLTRFTPEGKVAETVHVPVLRPTSLAFGGPGLRTMYITSASKGLSGEQLEQWPLSGAVIQREAAAPGQGSNLFRLARKASDS